MELVHKSEQYFSNVQKDSISALILAQRERNPGDENWTTQNSTNG
jgi:hypothetical protein